MELRYDPKYRTLYYKVVCEIGVAKCKEAIGKYIQLNKPKEGCSFTMVWHGRKWRLTYWNEGGSVLVESSKLLPLVLCCKPGRTENFPPKKLEDTL